MANGNQGEEVRGDGAGKSFRAPVVVFFLFLFVAVMKAVRMLTEEADVCEGGGDEKWSDAPRLSFPLQFPLRTAKNELINEC